MMTIKFLISILAIEYLIDLVGGIPPPYDNQSSSVQLSEATGLVMGDVMRNLTAAAAKEFVLEQRLADVISIDAAIILRLFLIKK